MTRDYRRGPMRGFEPYEAGKPSKEVQRELGIEGPIIKLASNENPLGVSPKAISAMKAAIDKLHLYPFDNAFYFKQFVAQKYGLKPSQVFAASGSVEIIELCGTVFLEPEDEVITSQRTFAMYAKVAAKAGSKFIAVPCPDNYSYDLNLLLKAVTPKTKIVFLANPTNPTGTWFTDSEFDAFMEALPEDIMVVYDVAYEPYVTVDNMPDPLSWLNKGRDILILKTLSKAHGLAGIRAGYAIGPEFLISHLNLGRTPFNMNILAQVGGMAAMADTEFLTQVKNHNTKEKKWLLDQLKDIDVVVPPSMTNFLLVDTKKDSKFLFFELQKKGVIVRPMHGYDLPNAIRVTIGTREENELFVEALKSLL